MVISVTGYFFCGYVNVGEKLNEFRFPPNKSELKNFFLIRGARTRNRTGPNAPAAESPQTLNKSTKLGTTEGSTPGDCLVQGTFIPPSTTMILFSGSAKYV